MADINVGAITEALNDKTDRDLQNVDNTAGADAVIEYQLPTAENGYIWYRKYKSGWVEQGGSLEYTAGSDTSVVFPVTMANTRYTAFAQPWNSGGYPIVIKNKTTTGFDVTGNVGKDGWQVSGMSAS